MPLAKRSVYPHHLCWAALPEGSELECVMNTTLSAIIHQLSSLSTQAEDMYRELFREAYTFYLQANTLQDRTNHLSFRVTQLDSSTEEVSLQDINMHKTFRSATVWDQQVVSKSTIPKPMAETYNRSDTTVTEHPLCIPGQKLCVDSTMSREVIKVRKVHNLNMMALDNEPCPDHRSPDSFHQGVSSEGCPSPEVRPHCPDIYNYLVTVSHIQVPSNHVQLHPVLAEDRALANPSAGVENEYHIIGVPVDMAIGAGAPMGYKVNGSTYHTCFLQCTRLQRCICVEYSNSDDDSELHGNKWCD